MKILKRIFIDGLSGMAIGLFATLIIGTILEQAGTIIGGDIGNMIVMVASIAKVLTGAGIGIGVASKLGESTLVCASAASAGMIGAFASGLLNGSVSSSGKILLSGPGEPLGAFVAAYIGIEIGRIFIGRTKLDIILTPFPFVLRNFVLHILRSLFLHHKIHPTSFAILSDLLLLPKPEHPVLVLRSCLLAPDIA